MSRTSSILFLSIAALLFTVVVVFTFKEVDIRAISQQLSALDLLWVLALGLLFRISFGMVLYTGFHLHYGLRIKPWDILLLPMMMHLFLYILPMKGGLLFQVFYSRHKYGLDMSKGFSLGVMIFLTSLVLAVLAGLAMAYVLPIESHELRTGLWMLSMSLVVILTGIRLAPKSLVQGNNILKRFLNFLINVRVELYDQFRNWKLTIGQLVTIGISTLIQALWFWQTALVFGIDCEFLPVLLVVLILQVVLLIRLVPGNLGIQEIMIGAVFAAAGFQLEDGLLIGVVIRLIAVLWATLIGLPSLYFNLKHFGSVSLSGLIKKVADPK